MKKILLALAFLATTCAQIFVTADVYSKLTLHERGQESAMEILGHYVSQQEFIESTVLKHDEEISTLKAVCGGK